MRTGAPLPRLASGLLVLALCLASSPAPSCRCLPGAACWSAVPWSALNSSVGGRLVPSQNPLGACLGSGLATPACSAALNSSDDEFWLTGQPNGYTRSGQYGAWDQSTVATAFSVLAESEDDMSATVAFASAHNLRLVVKGTGHGWFAGSAAAGGLLLWTHRLSTTTFVDALVPAGCAGAPVPAAIVGAGVQFRELYAAAAAAGRMVMGGTCDSVGVGGCWLGGCYGTFSKLYGSGASNMLEARVVLANGTLLTTSACAHPDLFWSLRGGGAGLAAAVVSFSTRTHAPPASVLLGSATFTVRGVAPYTALLEQAVRASTAFVAPPWGGSYGFGRGGENDTFFVSFGPKGFELQPADFVAALAPLLAWANATGGAVNASVSWSVWNASTAPAGSAPPWVEMHPDRELSTSIVASMSRWIPAQGLPGAAAIAAGFTAVTLGIPPSVYATVGVDFEKGAAGSSPMAAALFTETAQHPVLAAAAGMLLVAVRIPELPTLPVSSRVLAALWPRLQRYAVLSSADALYAPCAAGAAGNESAAQACHAALVGERVPALQAALAGVKAALYAALPDIDAASGVAVSGTYLNEAGWDDASWQRAQWGDAGYAALLAVKDAWDPTGLFICHHCVGSERFSPDGNCRTSGEAGRLDSPQPA